MYICIYIYIYNTRSNRLKTKEATPLAHRACSYMHSRPVGRTRPRENIRRVDGFPSASHAAVIHPYMHYVKKTAQSATNRKRQTQKPTDCKGQKAHRKAHRLTKRTQKRTGAICDPQSAPKSAPLAQKTAPKSLRGCSGQNGVG